MLPIMPRKGLEGLSETHPAADFHRLSVSGNAPSHGDAELSAAI